MYQFDDDETTALEVIDATLAGEAVDPEHAALAELTLILAGQRPQPGPEFAAALDERVARRFAQPHTKAPRRLRRRWLYAPGAALGFAAAIAVVVIAGSSGGASSSSTEGAAARPPAVALSTPARKRSPAAKASAPFGTKAHASAAGSLAGVAASSAGTTTAAAPGAAPAPSTSGRQIVQSAQLSLSTRPNQVDNVSQQVFNVVAAQNGVVKSSEVTAANSANGYAQFQLSVPSSNLSQTMAALSRLRGSSVVSRTDSTQDITGQVGGAGIRLADARALRTALLKQLANATTTAQIDSLRAQIHDAEASISSDEATLNALHHEVDFSSISVAINASAVVPPPVSGGGSFTLGKATHLAGRVLVVAAGVALIALAVLVPLGMLVAVVLWVAAAIRRRRREQALDLV